MIEVEVLIIRCYGCCGWLRWVESCMFIDMVISVCRVDTGKDLDLNSDTSVRRPSAVLALAETAGCQLDTTFRSLSNRTGVL